MKKRGIGFACALQGVNYHFGHVDRSTANLVVTEDDQFLIRTAASDIGEGLEAMLLLVVSHSFNGYPIEKIRWEGSNTHSPQAGGTGASRQSTLTGNAAHQASLNMQEKLRPIASELFDVPPAEIKYEGSEIIAGGRRESIAAVFAEARRNRISLSVEGSYQAPRTTDMYVKSDGLPISQFGYAVHVAEVEVDLVTGEVQVIKVEAFHDAGTILNHIGATAQVEGGIVMGIGFALNEEYLLENGRPVNVGFTNYLIPSIVDAPEIISHFLDIPSPIGALGVKGLAEIPVSVIAPAVVNAIYNACGARINHIPATPERVLSSLPE